ncbi:MAG: pilus assembly protein [Sphingomonadales bacterium]|nr:pilus assembly protein [Sphingomonadales bacterium]MBD3773820.1 pilus assembly protein [Paracoccaceae bacterium]
MAVWRFIIDRRGASGAEFAMILPLALLLLFGVIDVGVYAWNLNEYEKATQMGARFAVVTDVISPGLRDQSYIGYTCSGAVAPLAAGQTICADALGTVACTVAGCTCDTNAGNCPGGTLSPTDTVAIDRIIARMHQYEPSIDPAHVVVEYRGSGLGYAGDPNKPEIAPIVTVRIIDESYRPIVLSPFGGQVPLPDFSYSLTLEDGEGSASS